MNRSDLFASVPGIGSAQETYESVFRWGREGLGIIVSGQISGAARDAGNSPTSVLRPGLLLGQIAASGLLMQYAPGATDGTQNVFGVVMSGVRMVDLDANNVNRWTGVLVGGPVKAASLLLLDEQARASMADRFNFDDRSYQSNSIGWQQVLAKTANYTVVNGVDNNTIFTTQGSAGSVTFTLPTAITKGQRWKFFNEVGQTMIVAAAAGKLVTFNNAAATSVAFQTAGNLIGGSFEILVNADGTKYLCVPSGSNTVTVA